MACKQHTQEKNHTKTTTNKQLKQTPKTMILEKGNQLWKKASQHATEALQATDPFIKYTVYYCIF